MLDQKPFSEGEIMGTLWHGWWMYSWLILVVVIVVVMFSLVGKRRTIASESAKELLRRRYAAGEIDDKEFEQRLWLLENHRLGT